MAAQTPFSAGSFQLALDGAGVPVYIKAVDGGFARAAVVDEPTGTELLRIKHTSVAEIEPFSFEVGFAGSKSVLAWIRSSWKKEYARKNGDVVHADFNRKGVKRQQFKGALITETTFPTLDANSRENAFLKFKFLPEEIEYLADTAPLQANLEGPQKEWTLNSFRLVIDGVATPGVQKIESFTVKQGVKRLYTGRERFPQIEPTKIDFPNLSCTIAESNAAAILKWYKDFVVKGAPDKTQERNGAIEFLGPDKKTVMLRVELFEIGLCACSVMASQANGQATKSVKFELYVGKMEIDVNGSKGLG